MTEDREPERISRLAPEALEILASRCQRASKAPEKRFLCPICHDEGLVWVQQKARSYRYFAAFRCRCRGQEQGYRVSEEDRNTEKFKHRRTFGPRFWDSEIPAYSEQNVPQSQALSLTRRLALEDADERERIAAEDPAAIEERKAIQGDHGEVKT